MKNKTVIITGGNKGIGLAITKKFLNEKYNVIVGARTASALKKKIINKHLVCVNIDARFENSHTDLIDISIQKFGGFDAYINNVGFSEWRNIKSIDSKFLINIFEANVFSVFWGCKNASKYINKNGSIINVSSIAGKRGSLNNSAYSSTKFAVNGITQSLAKELGPKGIRVNAVCPVLIPTSGLKKALLSSDSPVKKSHTIKKFLNDFKVSQTALKRLPNAKEIADTCFYLSSSQSSAITGQCINVDCGVFPQ